MAVAARGWVSSQSLNGKKGLSVFIWKVMVFKNIYYLKSVSDQGKKGLKRNRTWSQMEHERSENNEGQLKRNLLVNCLNENQL